jgi:hypothetical protein
MTPKTAAYTAHKDKIMQNVADLVLYDIRNRIDILKYQYLNNTQIFESDIAYANFCKAKIRAEILKFIASSLERENI